MVNQNVVYDERSEKFWASNGWDQTSVFVILSPKGLSGLEALGPLALPHDGRPGLWLDPDHWSHDDPDLVVVSYDELFDNFHRWEAAVFRAQFEGERRDYGRPSSGRLRLLSRVEGWNHKGLWSFCWEQVRDAVFDMKPTLLDDGRLVAALWAAKAHHEGLIGEQQLTLARTGAKEFYRDIQKPDHEPGDSSWVPARWAAYAARACILLATPNPEHYPTGYTAMAAAEIAHNMRNQHPAAYISCKWLGVWRIADFLHYVDAGELWERDLIRHILWPDGRYRYANIWFKILPGEPRVDFFTWEAGACAGKPIRVDMYEGVHELTARKGPTGDYYLEQDGVPADGEGFKA